MPFQPGQSGNPAGRPKKAARFASQIAAAEQQIADRLPQLIAAQLTLALGVTVQEVDRDTGGVLIYQKPPDHKAGAYLIDRLLGKPTAHLEAEGQVEHTLPPNLDALITRLYGDGDDGA